jgi:hypothetical protein
MQRLHGTLFAAVFLADSGIPIALALAALASPQIHYRETTSGVNGS